MVKRKKPNKSAYYDECDLRINRPGRPKLSFQSEAERTLHLQHLKRERDRRYKAKLRQEQLDGDGRRLQAFKDRKNRQRARRCGNYALLAAPTAAAIARL